jgi:hypothetical protein
MVHLPHCFIVTLPKLTVWTESLSAEYINEKSLELVKIDPQNAPSTSHNKNYTDQFGHSIDH